MAQTTWTADPTHSEIQFKVKHLMITTISGHFEKYSVTAITEDPDFKKLEKVEFTADVDSITTKNEQRDTHLKSADFFNAAEHKQIVFKSSKYENTGGEKYKLYGDLTIRGTSKPIVLDVEFAGVVTDPYGNTKAGFSVDGKISRKEYGLQWNAVTEAGQVVVGDEIKIHCEIQLVRQ